MTLIDAVAILGMVGSVTAVLFAYFAWSATRVPEPFRLSPKADDVFVITRTGFRKAYMENLWVRHHRSLCSTDDCGDIVRRVLKNGEFITVMADDILTGEELTVIWRCWPLKKRQRHWRATHPGYFKTVDFIAVFRTARSECVRSDVADLRDLRADWAWSAWA